MYLHLGQNVIVREDRVLGIFDMDHSTISKHTREFLSRAQKENRVVNVSMELPKSFIVCEEKGTQTVYISQIAPSTLLKRAQSGALLDDPTLKKEARKEK